MQRLLLIKRPIGWRMDGVKLPSGRKIFAPSKIANQNPNEDVLETEAGQSLETENGEFLEIE